MTIAISKRNGAFQHLKNPLKQNGRFQTFLTIVNLIIIFSCTGTLIYQSKASLDRFLGYETKAILTGNVLYNFKDFIFGLNTQIKAKLQTLIKPSF